MINNNDERPRYDAVTGLPIVYDDDPANTVNHESNSTVNSHNDNLFSEIVDDDSTSTVNESKNENETSYSNDVYNNSAVTEESNSTQDGYSFNQYSADEESFHIVDKNAQKNAEKAAKKAAKKSSGFRKVVRFAAAGIMFGVIAGSTMYGVFYTGVSYFPTSSNKSSNIQFATVNNSVTNGTTSGIVSQSDSSTTMNVTSIAKAAMPAVVAISGTVTTSSSGYGFPFGSSGSSEAATSGTGIIIAKSDTELIMVTNAHVVDGVNNLKVTFSDNEAVDATVKGTKSEKDIAVIAVKISDLKSSTISSIAIAELGDSENIQVGESVVAIGNALGEGQSVTVGWVSALNRSITVDNTKYSNLIMTDAAINPGNSGGALLNAKGQVIGINSAKYASEEVEGMGYAIPISSVKDIIDNLMTKQTRSKVAAADAGYIGITGMDIPSNGYGFPGGVQISSVSSGSGAEKAGLAKGDIIVSFDGETVSSMTGLKSMLQYYAAGEKVAIEYYHVENNNYVLKQVDVTLTRSTN